MKVRAIAERSGPWWAVTVPEVDGLFTQTRRLDQVPAMVADAVELLDQVPADQVQVEVVPRLPDELEAEVTEVLEAARTAAEQAERASAGRREVVAELRGLGWSVRDVAVVLGISPQRVSQIEPGRSEQR